MRRTLDGCTQLVQINTNLSTFMLAKHTTSCDNVFLKDISYSQPTECSALLNQCNHCIKLFQNSIDVLWVLSVSYYAVIIFEDIVLFKLRNKQKQK
jgi:hypothetical protein